MIFSVKIRDFFQIADKYKKFPNVPGLRQSLPPVVTGAGSRGSGGQAILAKARIHY